MCSLWWSQQILTVGMKVHILPQNYLLQGLWYKPSYWCPWNECCNQVSQMMWQPLNTWSMGREDKWHWTFKGKTEGATLDLGTLILLMGCAQLLQEARILFLSLSSPLETAFLCWEEAEKIEIGNSKGETVLPTFFLFNKFFPWNPRNWGRIKAVSTWETEPIALLLVRQREILNPCTSQEGNLI